MTIKQRFSAEPLYLMDGSAFVYRGFYANQSMQRSDGFPTSALFIVARILLRILREEQPQYFAFVLDGHGTHFRHELFPLYKMQRRATPEDLIRQMEPIHRLVKALGLHLEISEQCEADDCLASLTTRYRAEHPIVLVATDKDLKQCLHENVLMWDPASREEKLVTLDSFQRDTGLTPAQWPDVQALIGDTSDNIPGVRGIGQKTAEKLFLDYPNLEAIRDGLDTLSPSLRKKFEGQEEAMFLYRQLTTLSTEQCPHLQLNDLRVRPVNRQEVATLLREFELHSLERELASLIRDGKIAVTADNAIELNTGNAPRAQQLSQQLSLLDTPVAMPRPRVSTLETLTDQIAGACVAVLDGHGELSLAVSPTLEAVLEGDGTEVVYTGAIPPLVEALRHAACLVAPDVKSLLHSHPAWKSLPAGQWLDLGLASYLLEPEERDYGWPKLAARWGTELALSTANPALLALAIAYHLNNRLAGAHLIPLMRELELPLIPVLTGMEEDGVLLDAAALADFLQEVQKELDRLTEEVYAAAQGAFNIRSAQQLGDVLFNRLKLPLSGKTKGGQASTSQDVLEKLSGHHPVVDALLEFRKLEKLRSTYLEPLPRLMNEDGRIRTTFNQLATATGRLSSSNPNLQNIPVRGSLGRRMRTCFTAPPSAQLISADYSQIELRVLAHLSQEPTLLAAFREGTDIHARTAGLLYDVSPDAVTPDQRRSAKTINFGLIYGMGAQKLAHELKLSMSEAKAFITRYFERLQGLKHFYEQAEDMAREQGYVTTLAGRRRPLPDIQAESQQARALARRQAINTLVQGSAADIIKLAMLAVYHDPALHDMQARLLLQVHDELLLEVPHASVHQAGERVAHLMATVQPNGITLDVPLVVDWNCGSNWGEAH